MTEVMAERNDRHRMPAANEANDDDEGVIDEPVSTNGAFHDSPTGNDVQKPVTERGYLKVASTASQARVAALEALGGGVYIPPGKRRAMMEEQRKKPNADLTLRQRETWQEQRRVVHGTINRLNASTIKPLIHDLFSKVNLIRLRGVLARSILQAAVSSPRYSNVYAALVAVLNTKLPEVGELVVKRAILAFRRHYRRKEKASCLAMAIFMGHLFHQAIVHELLILQILTLLLDGDPTDDSVEVAVQFLTVVGYALLEVSPAGVRAVLERLRALLHEGNLNTRVELKMEQLLALRKTGFRDHLPIPDELDLVERDDQITFELTLDDEDITKEENLDVFRVDEEYEENEKVWNNIRSEILGISEGDDDAASETDDSDDASKEEEESDNESTNGGNIPDQELAIVPATSQAVTIHDLSEGDLVHLRRTIYLTIMSSATFEECTHKLSKIEIPNGREEELINMIIECCSQERTFLRYYGLIGARFCLLDDRWRDAFLNAFVSQYTTIHRLETNKLRNVAKLFAHLLHTDSMPWSCLAIIHLNEDETTSSSRIFLKILIQEMAEAMGIARLKGRFETDNPEMADWYKGMFPQDNVRNTRYAINFFTSIGLGPLTDGLREFLKNAPKMILAQAQQLAITKKDDDDDSSVSTSSSSSSSSSESSSTSTDSSTSSYSRRRSSRSRQRGRRRRSESTSASSDSTGSYSSYSSRSSSSSRSRLGRKRRTGSRSPSPRPDKGRSRSPPKENRVSRSRSGSYSDKGHERDDSSPRKGHDLQEKVQSEKRKRSDSPSSRPRSRGKEVRQKRSKRSRSFSSR